MFPGVVARWRECDEAFEQRLGGGPPQWSRAVGSPRSVARLEERLLRPSATRLSAKRWREQVDTLGGGGASKRG
jgi:hypothetical protein